MQQARTRRGSAADRHRLRRRRRQPHRRGPGDRDAQRLVAKTRGAAHRAQRLAPQPQGRRRSRTSSPAFYRGRAIAGPGGGIGGVRRHDRHARDADASPTMPRRRGACSRRRTPTATPHYTSSITRLLDTADNAVLIRNMLLAQNDGNATIVARRAGHGARAAARPVRRAAADRGEGAGSSSSPSARIPSEPPSRRSRATSPRRARLFAEWPTPIVAVGAEVGTALPYPGASIEKDFAWSPAHPVVDAYRAFKPMPYDAPAPALAAVLYAVHPDDGLLHAVRARHDQRAGRRPDAVHAGRERQASVSDRRSGAEGARSSSSTRRWSPAPPAPRPGRGGRGRRHSSRRARRDRGLTSGAHARETLPSPSAWQSAARAGSARAVRRAGAARRPGQAGAAAGRAPTPAAKPRAAPGRDTARDRQAAAPRRATPASADGGGVHGGDEAAVRRHLRRVPQRRQRPRRPRRRALHLGRIAGRRSRSVGA